MITLSLKSTLCKNSVYLELICFFSSKGLGHAMWRDGSSGGVIRICAITEKGAERKTFAGDQVPQYYPK